MPAEGLEQARFVGGRGRCRLRHAFALGGRYGIPTFAADVARETAFDVQSKYWNAVDASEVEKRQVKRRRKVPDFFPVDCGEELLLGELARDPPIEHGLHSSRERLETDRDLRARNVEGRERLELPQVMIGIVVVLPQQDDIASGCELHDFGRRDAPRRLTAEGYNSRA